MARVALLCPDLLFGSKVEGALRAAGHEVTRYDSHDRARAAAREAEVLEAVRTAGDEDEPPAVAVEPPGRRLADPARRSGDQRCLHDASSPSTRAAPSRFMRERGTTRSKPASSARRRTSCSTCE